MIITVTLNPAIDKTAVLSKDIKVGDINRIHDIVYDAGGKGINVSRTILSLGGSSIATGFIGGYFGMMLERELVDAGIPVAFVHIDAETRTNTKIISPDGSITEFNEPGPVISEFEKNRLKEKLVDMADEDSIVVLSGSVPQGVEPTIYRDLIYALHEKKARVFSDIEGEPFRYAMEAVPDLLKPNKKELLSFFGKESADEDEIIEMGKYFIDKGVKTVVISCGKDGAYFITKEKTYKCPALDIQVASTVGAGDSMMAVFAYFCERGYDFKDSIKASMAVANACVTTEGTRPAPREKVEELIEKIVIEEI